jgi:hypothetical protein
MAKPKSQMELIKPDPPPKDFPLVAQLLEHATSLTVVGDYLKKRGLAHSAGSWEEMRENRLTPELRKGTLTITDLIELLAEVEEYGRAHTFLYTIPKNECALLLNEDRVRNTAKKLGVLDRLGPGQVLDQPATPTLTSIRLGSDERGTSLTLKVIEKRDEHELVGEEIQGDLLVVRYRVVPVRAVNVVRLFSFGLLEIRIQSHRSSTRYADDLARIREIVKDFVPVSNPKDFSLGHAKLRLWTQREKFADLVKFSTSRLRNRSGNMISATSGSEEKNLLQDAKVTASVDAFCAGGGAYCESSNLYWLKQDGKLPSRDIHMLLPELRNEFAIPANCSKLDYEYSSPSSD